MKYLNSTFTVQSPENTEGLTCPRCVFGEKWGEHVPGCLQVGDPRTLYCHPKNALNAAPLGIRVIPDSRLDPDEWYLVQPR